MSYIFCECEFADVSGFVLFDINVLAAISVSYYSYAKLVLAELDNLRLMIFPKSGGGAALVYIAEG